ncbi:MULTISPECIES: NADP-dependent malic enzyme [unclassified Hwanghaeella]|jgi:malate dehydrogenase (oxaloacetate-decarboxylating)(NADP+)|uniref:NADP-dependent malic enzyme n=1 Tax=unclassified Hwanghaeella TaxID=2605944 RepID=UPI000C8A6626|nr:NADP-dependent malic enzyme [Rhodospirillales bacterium]|tara:strand:- start:18151 stop:20433 length:2283 start_codon:yes stop_codon:yes gene_type:complete
MAKNFDQEALAYHRMSPAGKLAVVATKPLATQRDLSLAYSPGVAAACREIERDPVEAAYLTARANLVGVITNGTAVLGLGAIGALASKPVMEGKAVLFKKFAGIDVFDIEVDETDPDKFCAVVSALEPTFGGINLEDIKAPECFEIEKRLRAKMKIPVFHDDQHGTAIIVAAAVLNGLELLGEKFEDIKIVTSGAGAAALACLSMLVAMGAKRENIWVTDIDGLVYEGREQMDEYKGIYAKQTNMRTLDDVIDGADVFLGLSAPNVLKPEMVKRMGKAPIILALANPNPEILPEDAMEARPDAIVATGRSDYPNQVNNVLCFPFIFRGALDVGATTINEEMKVAAVKAIAALARREVSEVVAKAYGSSGGFGRDHLIPKPFDPRLILEIAPAVARAAMESGVATRPIEDFEAYNARLESFVYRSGTVMKPIIDRAVADPRRVVYAEGEEERVLRAVQIVVDDGIAHPILIGRRKVIEQRIERLGLRLVIDRDFELCDPEDDPRYKEYWTLYHELTGRQGVSPELAREVVRTRTTVIGSLMVRLGQADALICGTMGRFRDHLKHVRRVIGVRSGARDFSTLNMLILNKGIFFFCDTHVSFDPTVEELVEMAILAAEEVRRFGIEPKIAMLSHANFGSSDSPSSIKMRQAVAILQRETDLEVEGEMHADTALDETLRATLMPENKLTGSANLMIMPTLDAANIAYNAVKMLGDGLSVGPIMIGSARPVHILTTSLTARGIVNMTAVAVVDAQMETRTSEKRA